MKKFLAPAVSLLLWAVSTASSRADVRIHIHLGGHPGCLPHPHAICAPAQPFHCAPPFVVYSPPVDSLIVDRNALRPFYSSSPAYRSTVILGAPYGGLRDR